MSRMEKDMRDHPKWLALSPLAYRLGVRLILWAREHSPTGFVPHCVVEEYSRTKTMARKLSRELVECGRHLRPERHGILEVCESGFNIHDFDVYGQPDAAYAHLPVAPLAMVEPKTSKSEAGRLGGQRSVEARRSTLGTAQPRGPEATPKHRPEAPPRSTAEAAPGLTIRDLSGSGEEEENPDLLLHSPEDLKESARDDADEKPSGIVQIRPTNLESAIKMPVLERAQYAVANRFEAGFLTPQAWPEVRAVFKAFEDAWGIELGSPGHYDKDPGTRAAVVLLASFPLEAIRRGAALSLKNPLIKNGQRAIAAISPEVLRRTLSADFGAPRRTSGGPQPDDSYDPYKGREVVK